MNEFLLERRESIRTQREAELRSSLQERHLHHVHTVPSTPAQQASDSESDDVDDSNNGELNVSASPSAPAAATGDCHSINLMLQRNRVWRENVTKSDPTFFERLSVRQTPEFLAIGCSDSRVSIELLTGVGVGELFVHRNIANMVVNTDISCLSVIQYAVEVLKVRHIVVIGHRECGGVRASLDAKPLGVIDNWLRNIQDVYRLHQEELDALHGEARLNRLVELNVTEQVLNVYKNGFVQKARALNGGWPHIHGLVYDMRTGALEQLGVDVAQIFEATSHVFSYERGSLTRTLSN